MLKRVGAFQAARERVKAFVTHRAETQPRRMPSRTFLHTWRRQRADSLPDPEFQRLNVRREAMQRIACGPLPVAAVLLRSRVPGTDENRREGPTEKRSLFAAFASSRGELQVLILRLFIGETGFMLASQSHFPCFCGHVAVTQTISMPSRPARLVLHTIVCSIQCQDSVDFTPTRC